ncbi:N-acetyltransferase [Beduini massiliensis]|uniref:N-acetyltransferase n=1 Tax=Beduini massiliensis TaxID=1585974 RepID=UPI00059A9729|nr:N-acetyltransferase [Beduini massiliensis]
MELRLLEPNTIKTIFHQHIVNDFPVAETRPLKNMMQLYHTQHYKGYGLYEQDQLLGYAFFAGDQSQDVLLLDYFAVIQNKRSFGYGSQFLQLLKKEMHGNLIIAEVESIESTPNIEEKQLRHRRIQFYLRNHFKQSSLNCRLFGVHYSLLYLSDQQIDDDTLYDYIKVLYHSIFNPLIYKMFVKLKRGVK